MSSCASAEPQELHYQLAFLAPGMIHFSLANAPAHVGRDKKMRRSALLQAMNDDESRRAADGPAHGRTTVLCAEAR